MCRSTAFQVWLSSMFKQICDHRRLLQCCAQDGSLLSSMNSLSKRFLVKHGLGLSNQFASSCCLIRVKCAPWPFLSSMCLQGLAMVLQRDRHICTIPMQNLSTQTLKLADEIDWLFFHSFHSSFLCGDVTQSFWIDASII